jgi:hypothetical protein
VSRTPEPVDEHPRGALFWVGLVLGWGVIAFALHGLVTSAGTNPPALFRLLIGLNLANDLLVVPIAIGCAVLVRRVVPGWAVAPVDAGLVATAAVVLYAYPLLGDWTRTARAGYSRLPLDYAHSLAMVLGAIWFACSVLALVAWRRTRSTRR